MSFHFYKANYISNNKSVVPSGIPQTINPSVFERTLKTSFSASLTIEASLALPLFIFFSVCIVHFLILIYLQEDIQLHLEEAARDLSRSLYVSSSQTSSLVQFNLITVRAKVLDNELTTRLDKSQVQSGSSGLSLLLSSYDDSSGQLDLVATYVYEFPYLPGKSAKLSFMQQCRCRAWIGLELCEDSRGASSSSASSDSDSDSQTVYITPSGTAYHLSASCNYLDLSIQTVSADSIDSLRNASGGRYTRCSCAESGAGSYYVTDYGEQYHSSLTCSDLKRTVTAVDIEDVEGRHLCPKCAAAAGE